MRWIIIVYYMNFCFGFWRSIVSPWILWENNALELAIRNACYICSKHMPYDTWQFFFTFDNVTRSLKCPEIFLWSIFLLKCYKNHSILNELNLNNQFYSVYMIIHFIHVHRPCGFHDWIGLLWWWRRKASWLLFYNLSNYCMTQYRHCEELRN